MCVGFWVWVGLVLWGILGETRMKANDEIWLPKEETESSDLAAKVGWGCCPAFGRGIAGGGEGRLRLASSVTTGKKISVFSLQAFRVS